MASTRKLNRADGTVFYEIIVSRGRSLPQLTTRWTPQRGWSKKTIDRELAKVAAEFERRCEAGEVLSKREIREKELAKAAADARILTFKQYTESIYMPSLTVRCSENTRYSYQTSLDIWIYPAFGDKKITQVTPIDIEDLFTHMQAMKKMRGTVVKVYTVLQCVFKKAYRTDVIDRNPMDKIDKPKPRKDEEDTTEAEACTAEEILYIWECLEKEPLKWQALVRLLIDTGMRRGECCGLQWGDVDFENCTLTIRRNLCYTPSKGTYVDTPKTRQQRSIDVDPAVIELLERYREAQRKNNSLGEFIFTMDNLPNPMHPQSPTGYLRRFQKKYSIDHLYPHKLRHSFASIAITSGADVASVSEKIGHSDKSTTLRMYTHSNKAAIKHTSEIFRAAIQKAGEQEKQA